RTEPNRSEYTSEPTLAKAVAYTMNIESKFIMPDMLAMPTNSIKKGVVEASYRGELVARLLLIIVYDYACCQLSSN
ncbi:11779_t:CDS:1, partial [Entrophospora sp. SA101]